MTKYGEVQEWMAQFASQPAPTECVYWPFTVTKCGHAKAWSHRLKRMDSAYRVVWETVHRTPFPSPQACHSCGNGDLGCVNYGHIDPGTHRDNMADRRADGRDPIGSAHGRALLVESDVWQICERLADGERMGVIARDYGVHLTTIADIWSGKKWTHVPAPRLADTTRRCLDCGTVLPNRHAGKRYCDRRCLNRTNGRRRTERRQAERG